MPETVADATLATLLLAVLVAFTAYGTRRWGTKAEPDAALVLLRRLRSRPERELPEPTARPTVHATAADSEGERRGWFRRRKGAETTEGSDVGEAAPEAEDVSAETSEEAPEAPEPLPPSDRPNLDYVPFPTQAKEGAEDGEGGGRFRRALQKTREYLNRDVAEAFGAGPVPEAFESLEEILVRADVGVAAATGLSDELRERGRELTAERLSGALQEAMRGYLEDADRRLRVNSDGVSVWMVVGVNGTGKTTSIAKLAQHAKAQGFRVCLAAADTYRAAAIEQLELWAKRVGVELIRQHPGADPAAVVYDAIEHCRARGYDLLICDTAGRLHTRKPLMEELSKVRRVIERNPGLLTECLLVLDATTGQNGIAQTRAFREAVEVTGLVLAKLDGTAKGGIVFAVEREIGVPVKVIGTGEKAEDLAPFDPDAFVNALFEG